jgi:hypothetical protein
MWLFLLVDAASLSERNINLSKQVGAPTVPSAVIECQFCYWTRHLCHLWSVI